ncbi:GFA family protein [Phenylobacterium sp.]|uniref:GFA family protein n=1 Tax=Phenylobacterium sp. TaxID=1871053 RepID=UPI003BACDFD0
MTRYAGSCHCGVVTFVLEAEIDHLTACDCSLCVKKNARMVRVAAQALTILSGEDQLGAYEWNTHRARHHFCRVCGIYVFHRKRASPDLYEVNVFCLDGFDSSGLPVRASEGVGMSVVGPGRPEWRGPRAD